MSKLGIAKIESGRAVNWAPLVDSNRCWLPEFANGQVPDPLPTSYVAADSLEDAWTPIQHKQHEVHRWWQLQQQNGYAVTSLGIEIRWNDEARRAVSEGIALINELLQAGSIGLSSPIEGWVDRFGVAIKIEGQTPTAGQLKQITAEMGVAYQQLRTLHAAYLQQLAQGETGFTVGEPLP